MKSNILPSNFRSVFPALIAMFAISATFTLYNFALFQNVMERHWDNTFITLTYDVCFAFCIFGFVGLLLRPMLVLRKKVMFGVALLVSLGAVVLFQNADHKAAWVLFFLVQGGTSVFWHQNVRLTLIENAHKDEYARVFSLYMISHVSGNVLGGFLFKALTGNMQILAAVLSCYVVGVVALFCYPKENTEKPFQGQEVITLRRFTNLVKLNPFIWIVSLAAGFLGETFFNFYVPYLNQNGIAPVLALSALQGFQIGGVLFKYPTATLMDKLGLFRTTGWVAAIAIALNIVLVQFVGSRAVVVIGFALLLGGILSSLTIVGDTAITTVLPKREHQEAATLSILIYFLGGLLGNSVVGPAMDQINPATFPVITIVFIGLMLAGLLPNRARLIEKVKLDETDIVVCEPKDGYENKTANL